MLRDRLVFFVPSQPAPGGSKKTFPHIHTGKMIVKDTAKRNAPWRESVAFECRCAMVGKPPMQGPLWLLAVFCQVRPKSHFGSGRNAERLKPTAPVHPIVPPDATKLLRSTEDAMTGIAWEDDKQIVDQFACKRYAMQSGALLIVLPMIPGDSLANVIATREIYRGPGLAFAQPEILP